MPELDYTTKSLIEKATDTLIFYLKAASRDAELGSMDNYAEVNVLISQIVRASVAQLKVEMEKTK